MSQPIPMPTLPDALRACVSEASEAKDPLTNAELETFLNTHTGGGCEADDCTNTPEGQANWFKTQVAQGASRHDSMCSAGVWAMCEAMGGCYPARGAHGQLFDAFTAAFANDTEPARCAGLANEFTRIMAWAAAQGNPDRAHREPEIDEQRLWSCGRGMLAHIYEASLAQQMDPRGVLAVTLTRVIASIPSYVTLPGITASRSSLNLHVALVGPSSGGKSSSVSVAKDAIAVTPEPETATLGSGEGIAKAYAYRDKSGVINTVTDTLLFCDTEIESVEALAKRSGSPLMSQWRKTFTGERLGFQYSDPKHRIPVLQHRYRFCQILGIQPELAGWLLTGTQKSGGTPQRILWAPVVYSDMPEPDKLPMWPGQKTLPKWPLPQAAKKKAGQTFSIPLHLDNNVNVAADENVLRAHELKVPPEVERLVREARYRFHRGEVDGLAGHSTLTRLKVSAGFMWLDGRTDKISAEDWELAGIVMAISDRTRTETLRALDASQRKVDHARGKADAHRELAKVGVLTDEHQRKRVGARERILSQLASHAEMTPRDLRNALRTVEPDVIEDVLADLVDEGAVKTAQWEHRGRSGLKYRLAGGSQRT